MLLAYTHGTTLFVCLLGLSAGHPTWLIAVQVGVKDFDSYLYGSRERVFTIY